MAMAFCMAWVVGCGGSSPEPQPEPGPLLDDETWAQLRKSLNTPPAARITATQDHNVPFRFNFSAADSFDSDGTIVSYEWEISNLVRALGNVHETPRPTGMEVSHNYWKAGERYIFEFIERQLDFDQQINVDEQLFYSTSRFFTTSVYLTVTDDLGATDVADVTFRERWYQSVAGLHGLIERVKAAGGPFGVLSLMDVGHACSLDLDDERDGSYCDPSHPRLMRAITLREGVPEENLLMTWEAPGNVTMQHVAILDIYAQARNEGMVVSEVDHPPVGHPLEIEYLKRLNMVWVSAAGNAHDRIKIYDCQDTGVDDRDFWNVNYGWWGYCERRKGDAYEHYHRVIAMAETGRTLVAAAHGLKPDGTVEPNIGTNRCGDLMESCFSMLAPHTSGATATLGAVMYYFMHMYDDATEAVAALKKCTRDVGEPGVDREYGQGVIDLRFCPEARLPILDPATRASRRKPNLPPIPVTGGDRTVKVGDTVTLDGSGSIDPEGGTLLYRWEREDRSHSFLPFGRVDNKVVGGADQATHVFTLPPYPGQLFSGDITSITFRFRLYVTDEGGLTANEAISVVVNNPRFSGKNGTRPRSVR